MPEVTNWFGDIVSHPSVVVDAHSAADIVAVLTKPAHYPSPVRAVGSNHSTERCATTDGGTILRIRMNHILDIGPDTVTVEAGAILIDIAEALEKQGLQFYVNTEIGSLTAGSAACCGTKDGSFPGEFGQAGSYVTALKMVLPSGDLLEVTEAQTELMQKVRSSYGAFGVIYEVTFRVRPLLPMAVYHETYSIEDFTAKFPELAARNESMMFYMFPLDRLITTEFRRYNPLAEGLPNRHSWKLRNFLWADAGPRLARQASENIGNSNIRYALLDGLGAMWRFKLENLVCGDYTIPTDQIIRYPEVAGDNRYTFSLFAFPESTYLPILAEFFDFSRQYLDQTGYRIDLLDVGYRISQDQGALLSYSFDSPVMTIDPVSTGGPGWREFLTAYNQFCSDRGGKPLFNQTFGVTREIARKAYGGRLQTFAEARASFDPGGRLLNAYFADILS